MADQFNILFVMPLIITEDLYSITEKIKQVLIKFPINKRLDKIDTEFKTKVSNLELSYRRMEETKKETVALQKSIGKIISEEIIPYPPGIPILLSGEKIEDEHIKLLVVLKRAGAHFQGNDVFENGVKVFKSRNDS
ncbi:hypothetical protein BKP35_12330 [Anaerobacillus arseniciselenatis]|uniref:Orn/Lys/Arg decarboxylase C-terminal domain-containing protein n=1 Tax=Anaerobacillus arseniciselenatis TaxID=85682 RepID=A0A1S2LFY3_9BACI|nr:hypothetical protein BKP35_12330 [Anaerobacillus arseniciselenatis]